MTFGIVASSGPLAAGGYTAAVLADSPLLYWRLGESSGTTAEDSSGNGYDGTYVNTPTLGVTGAVAGDTAATFVSMSSEYAILSDAAWMDVTSITVEAWVKSSDAGVKYIVCREHDGTSDRSFSLRLDADEKAEFLVFNAAGSNASPSGTTNISDGNWHHVVGTFDGTTVRIYVDGSEENTASLSGNLRATAADLRVAARLKFDSTPGDFYNGTVDEVAIYDTALSAARIAAHYAAA